MTSSYPTLRLPSAFLPIVMSLGALGLVLGQLALVGGARQADEGTSAHLWQLLMAAQVPIVAFFAIKYLPQQPKPALLILSLQVLAVLAACAPVYLIWGQRAPAFRQGDAWASPFAGCSTLCKHAW